MAHLARLFVVGVISCGGARSASGPQPDLDKMVMYEPFAARSDAKRPHQAIIHGTDAKGGSTVIKLPGEPVKAVADAIGVRVKLETAPNTDGTVRVGIFEDKVDAKQQWRASVWVAALVAAHTLNKDLTDFTFSATSSGEIEGPSASGLIAAGFLATMTGAAIDPKATVAGAINADGTIGPAGGLDAKVKAALAAGVKKIGYPSGMRIMHVDGKTIDIAELAKASGATAVEVADVYEAYKLITGKTLLAPVPVAASDMTIDATSAVALDAKFKVWQARLAEKAPAMAKLEKGPLARYVTAAKQASDRAAQWYAKGATVAAFGGVVSATTITNAVLATADVIAKVTAGDLAGARGLLTGVAHQLDNKSLQTIAEQTPSTIGGHILMMAAFQTALRGSGQASLAQYFLAVVGQQLEKPLAEVQKDIDGLVAALIPAEVLIARSIADSQLAIERLEIENVKSLSYMCSIPNVRQLAIAFRSSSAAGLSYLDALLVEPMAAKQGVTADTARLMLVTSEPDYLITYAFAHFDQVADDIKQILGESSIAWNLMLLAGAERAYVDAAQLTAKYYSFAATSYASETDRGVALDRLLVNADRAARSSARSALVATGAIPVQAKLSYQLAVVQRDGDIASKLDALSNYWTADTYSRTAVMLARN